MRILLVGIWIAALLFVFWLASAFIDSPVPINVPVYLLGTYLPTLAVIVGWPLVRRGRFGKFISFLLVLLSVPGGFVCVFSAPQVQHATAGIGIVAVPLLVVVIISFVAWAVSTSLMAGKSDRAHQTHG